MKNQSVEPERLKVMRAENARIARTAQLTGKPEDQKRALESKRAYNAARIEEFVAFVLATSPPLTNAQRQRIARILRDGG